MGVGVILFRKGEEGRHWFESNEIYKKDFLSYNHDAWIVPTDGADGTREGSWMSQIKLTFCNMQYICVSTGLNVWLLLNIYAADKEAVDELTEIDDGNASYYGGRLVVSNGHSFKVQGSREPPHYIILIQFPAPENYNKWIKNGKNWFDKNKFTSHEIICLNICNIG